MADVRDLTPAEREDRIAEEAAADQAQVAVGQASPAPSRASLPSREPIPERGRPEPERQDPERAEHIRNTLARQRETRARIQNAVIETLGSHPIPGYRFRGQIATGGLKLDGVLLSEEMKYPDIVLHFSTGTSTMPKVAINRVDRVISEVARYEARSGRPARAWMLVVVPSEERGEPHPFEWQRVRESLDEALKPLGVASILLEQDVPDLVRLFADDVRPRLIG